MHYRIGTRGSKLALVQSEYVKRRMEEAYPEDTFELVIIKTTGDKVTDKPLAAIGTKGLFVKEIEEELLSGSIDMAVHSMKDMPAECETGLTFAKAWKREDCRDVLILKTAGSFSELPSGAVIGTGSIRRACQLAMLRPDIQFTAIRGNVDTRINKLMDDSYGLDGIVLAAAGLNRLGRSSEITEYLDPEVVIPAPAQGVLAIETAEVNTELLDKINALSDDNSDREAVAERTFLRLTGGGCHAPVGAHCVTKDNGDLLPPAVGQAVDGVHQHHFIKYHRIGVGPENMQMLLHRLFLTIPARIPAGRLVCPPAPRPGAPAAVPAPPAGRP